MAQLEFLFEPPPLVERHCGWCLEPVVHLPLRVAFMCPRCKSIWNKYECEKWPAHTGILLKIELKENSTYVLSHLP